MADDAIFETRLAAALGRYADLAPAMDDEEIARAAITAARPGRMARWLAALRGTPMESMARRELRAVYLLVLLALLIAALLIAVAGGYFRQQPLPLPSANGTIVFSFQGNNHATTGSVAVDADGTGHHSIDAGRCPTYSKDGGVLAWLSYEGSAAYLVVASADATPERKVLLVEQPQQEVSFALSPDGSHVAWFKPASESRPELWVAPLDVGPAARIAPASTVQAEFLDTPLWSPDGRHIAFGSYVKDLRTGETRRTAIDVVGVDGANRRRLTTRTGVLHDGLAWSPDGRHLAYAASATPGDQQMDLYVVGVDGTGDQALATTPVTEHDPAWSPDGAFLGFETSTEGAADRLSTVRMDGPTPVGPPLTGPESDWFVWSPDGRQLLWQELSKVGRETFRTTLHSIDREFRQPPTELQVVDGLVVCPPSWQRLGS